MLQKIDENIWVVRSACLPFGALATMTLVRLKNNQVIVISPIRLDDALKAAIESIGEISFLIAPNGFHYLFLSDFLRYFPKAQYYYSPALIKKIKKIQEVFPHHKMLDENINSPWMTELRPLLLGGMPNVQEFVFYHQASKTLIACDFMFLIRKPVSRLANLVWRLFGIKPQVPSQSRYFRFQIKDQEAFQRSLEEISKLDLRRIIVAHEAVIEGSHLELTKKLLGF